MHKILFKKFSIIILIVLFSQNTLWAQLTGNRNTDQQGFGNSSSDPLGVKPQDSTKQKKNKLDWDEEPAIISYTNNSSETKKSFDTTLLFFHRNKLTQPVWYSDLGNWGSPAKQLYFKLNDKPGLHLGYSNWDVYTYKLDSIPFITTTRPYTSFSFTLGSKQLQWVEFLHTQNINPRWNFAFKVSNNTSEGFYRTQKASGFNSFLNSNYKSENKRHTAKFTFLFNNFKNDENGGIVSDSFLRSSIYSNRSLIPVVVNSLSSTTSPINNRMSMIELNIENAYAWGKRDTTYNADSTKASYDFTRRFSIKHVLDLNYSRHKYTDGLPLTSYYLFIDSLKFGANDTVRSWQSNTYFDNRFTLNTFLGKDSQLVNVEGGLGIRYDWLSTLTERNGNKIKESYLNNYVFGQLRKDALADNQWSFLASLKFFYTGVTAGNTDFRVSVSKLFPKLGEFNLGATQSINAPSYQQTIFQSNFFKVENSFNNTSHTQLYAELFIKALKLKLGLRNHLAGNYIYLDENQRFVQYSSAFSILQLDARKIINFGAFSFDNELVWQQVSAGAPINVPDILFRSQITYKLPLFKNRLDSYLGIQATYNTPYKADGYSFVYNQYYLQNDTKFDYYPTLAAFFNFKVKRLRMFVMGDQLQQLFNESNNQFSPNYPAPNASFRFGFNWIMMN